MYEEIDNIGDNSPTQIPISKSEPIRGWNWGAFMFTWLWGIGNSCYLTLLVFVPLLNIVWPIVCGLKGNEWAISSGTFTSVEEFNAVQKSWNKAGFACFIASLIFLSFYFFLFVSLIGTLMVE